MSTYKGWIKIPVEAIADSPVEAMRRMELVGQSLSAELGTYKDIFRQSDVSVKVSVENAPVGD